MKFLLIATLCISGLAYAQNIQIEPTTKSGLWVELYQMDSLLFECGFNHVDTSAISPLIMEDLEFYHDKYGVTNGKADFLQSILGIGTLPFKTTRKLVVESVEVFPLYIDNGVEMYAAIQSGMHEFYQQVEGEEARKSSTARFTHLWILEGKRWKLKRVLSYDHQGIEE